MKFGGSVPLNTHEQVFRKPIIAFRTPQSTNIPRADNLLQNKFSGERKLRLVMWREYGNLQGRIAAFSCWSHYALVLGELMQPTSTGGRAVSLARYNCRIESLLIQLPRSLILWFVPPRQRPNKYRTYPIQYYHTMRYSVVHSNSNIVNSPPLVLRFFIHNKLREAIVDWLNFF